MTHERLLTFADAEPFRPFRIRMASGRRFDIRRAEAIRVGDEMVVVFEFRSEDDRAFKTLRMFGLSLVESIEHIDRPIAQG